MGATIGMHSTRWEIVQFIKRRGRATVEAIATHLDVTPMAIRLHLVVLERDCLVSRSTLRHGPGRPALIYTLTDRAGDLFPKNYDLLANLLLDGLRQRDGDRGVIEACRAAAAQLSARYRLRVAGKDFAARVAEVSAIFSELGGDVTWEPQGENFLMKTHNCPYQRVAEEHREVCGIDRQMLSELLDADLESAASVLDDFAHCTYLIRPRTP